MPRASAHAVRANPRALAKLRPTPTHSPASMLYSTFNDLTKLVFDALGAAEACAGVTLQGAVDAVPEAWPEGQSAEAVAAIKRHWAGALVAFTDGTFGYVPDVASITKNCLLYTSPSPRDS